MCEIKPNLNEKSSYKLNLSYLINNIVATNILNLTYKYIKFDLLI